MVNSEWCKRCVSTRSKSLKLLTILCLFSRHYVLSTKTFVTKDNNNNNKFSGSGSGVRLREDHSNITLNSSTTCFRIFSEKILNDQYIFVLDPLQIGTSFSKDNTIFVYESDICHWPESYNIVKTIYIRIFDSKFVYRILPYELPGWQINQ